ncbi:MAG TPA: hypothetical protein VHO67_05140 [Polyangia bacterium]|nr:hypothetical protein [Polyangia bacterium]
MSKKLVVVCLVCAVGCGEERAPLPASNAIESALAARPSREHRVKRPPRRFEPRGVGGGGALYGPTINPRNPDEVYVGTDMTDLFHSLDFGASWETVPFTAVQGDNFTNTQFTADPAVLYALTNDTSGVYDVPVLVKTVDHGHSWSPLLPGTLVNYISADPDSSRRLIAVDSNHVYFSADGGATFATVYTNDAADGLVLGGAFWRGRDVFAGTSDGMLVSRDGGRSFALSTVGGIAAGEGIVSFAGAQRGRTTRFYAVTSTAPYAGMTGGDADTSAHAYRLTDGDPAWRPMNMGLADDEGLAFVASALDDVNVAYAAGGNVDTSFDVVLRTRDGGATWERCFLTDHNQNVATGWAGEGGWAGLDWTGIALGLAVAPHDSRRVVLSDVGAVHVSSDGAGQWRAAYVKPSFLTPPGQLTPIAKPLQSNGLDPTSVWYMTWANASTIFTSVTDIRSEWSNDGGRTWIRPGDAGLDLNTTFHAVRDPASGRLFAGTSTRHDIYQSTTLTDDRIDTASGAIMVSNDDGRHFQLLEDVGHPVIFLAIDPHHPNRLYASVVHSQVGGIYRKDLDAPSAPAVRLAPPPRTSGHPFNIWVLDDGSLVASYSAHRTGTAPRPLRGPFTASSGVFLSSDGGATWSDRSDPNMQYWTKDVVIDPGDPAQNTWYAGVFNHADDTQSGGLYRTTDRGLTWTRLAGPFNVESLSVDPRHPEVAYYSTETRGLWFTANLHDPQPTFTLVDGYPFRQPLRIFFNPYDDDEVWVTSFGNGMRVGRTD